MLLHETLDLVLEQMEFGICRALAKDDLKFRCQDITGHYPRRGEFDRAFEAARAPDNKHNLVYYQGIGWYKSGKEGVKKYKDRLNNQIIKRQQYKAAIR